ncbi:hypothetical protein IscW_ISCW006191 [Ixodes scapularis]|uniref:Uncharacterized protein n=1 Tax=Ixodes scapularis TaxID=6945 RepID=B7PKF9_IXOSC|nr:hypothetical protein IscW_ISCW006191 [Ixodes scapularis]|eukprot:XP_002399915.1 hypothetical protein IscW_ISCW006191 [Ixodes scapularis]
MLGPARVSELREVVLVHRLDACVSTKCLCGKNCRSLVAAFAMAAQVVYPSKATFGCCPGGLDIAAGIQSWVTSAKFMYYCRCSVLAFWLVFFFSVIPRGRIFVAESHKL